MRIGLNTPNPQPISNGATATSRGNATQRESVEQGKSLPEDTVTISNLAAQALQTPEIRQAEIERLQESVQTGRYQIDPQAIAEAMLKK